MVFYNYQLMINILSLSIPVLIKRCSIVLTLCCAAYIVYFFVISYPKPLFIESGRFSKDAVVSAPAMVFELPSFESVASTIQQRDIFMAPGVEALPLAVEQTPEGNLPAHFKVVGIMIAHPSQLIIEDLAARKTYFIIEGRPQAGINIVRVEKDRIIVNHQGQDILISVK